MSIATGHSNKFHRVNRRILSNILLPRQNVVAATCRTKLNWFDFVRHVAATKFWFDFVRHIAATNSVAATKF